MFIYIPVSEKMLITNKTDKKYMPKVGTILTQGNKSAQENFVHSFLLYFYQLYIRIQNQFQLENATTHSIPSCSIHLQPNKQI